MTRILVLIAAMIISVSAFSQNYKQAIGVKFGNTFVLEYKLNTTSKNFLQLGFHLPWDVRGLYFSGFYNWNYNIDPIPGLSLYVGPGAYVGGYLRTNQLYLSINVMLGMEYKFDTIPLALAIDFTPGGGISPNYHFAWNIGLGVKYTL